MTRKLLFLMLAFAPSAMSQTPAWTKNGGTLTYGPGSVMVKGTSQAINTGSLNAFAASQGTCTLAALFAGTDACEYVYYPGTGTALLHSTSVETALPYVLAAVTTDASSNVLTISDPPFSTLAADLLTENPASIISFVNCKTTSVCAQTLAPNHLVITGTVSLSGGVVTVTNLPFANANYRCFGNDNTANNPVRFSGKAAGQATINGTGSDSIDYECVGKSQ
ncbi:MAG TPA: hypothetical protein VGW33_11215 [Terriglobia bacterium]|nr:hypothetical protein [Terriglobia bacterium]